ncbi:hypothetical protein ABES03_08625 [Neobacillus rhizosphaerae]|uniref:hypothetical protein n=1 Tax=Neobacillus rhizosphaerae TaxID=2880965 RepID=UPI003D2E2016
MISLKDTVTVEKAGGLDDWGRPTGTATETFKCRIDYRTEVVKTDNGEDAVSKCVILIKGVALVTTNDTVKWSDAYGDHEAKPLSVSPLKDFSSKVLFTKVVV